jgi:DNA-directed RNA polymerase subunit RPC12/RpoP
MMAAVEFVPARCSTCGGDLKVPRDRTTVICMYCGMNVLIKDDASPAATVSNWMGLADTAKEAQNFAEAEQYYTRVLEVDACSAEAWFGKAEAAGWQSTLANFRILEMLTCFQKAFESASGLESAFKTRAALSIATIVPAYMSLSYNHLVEFGEVDSVWPEHFERSAVCLETMEVAVKYAGDVTLPDGTTLKQLIVTGIVQISKDGLNLALKNHRHAPLKVREMFARYIKQYTGETVSAGCLVILIPALCMVFL